MNDFKEAVEDLILKHHPDFTYNSHYSMRQDEESIIHVWLYTYEDLPDDHVNRLTLFLPELSSFIVSSGFAWITVIEMR
ncbi:hypothetical protein KAR91_84205 [Candidatus Pacearchaeota archaeon]|nr:hypothetical protein [Candidatus Pacearchaeota archaeon]